jgi:hypothetical protein
VAVDPLNIIEQQLEFLQSRSEKHLLTLDETSQLAALVKIRLVMRSKGNGNDDRTDPYSGLSADELKQLLPLLE